MPFLKETEQLIMILHHHIVILQLTKSIKYNQHFRFFEHLNFFFQVLFESYGSFPIKLCDTMKQDEFFIQQLHFIVF